MADQKVDLAAFKFELDKLAWIKERRDELDEMEHNARSAIEEILPTERKDRDNEKIVGTLNGKPVIEWRPSKQQRLNQSTLRNTFPKVYEFCRETVYGRSMHLLEPKE